MPEVQKSPEVENADKLVRRFMKAFMTNLLSMQTDLIQYRQYTSEVKKRVLWPKVITSAELEAIKEKDAQE